MKPMLNPLTNELKLVNYTQARRLREYGWRDATTAEYHRFKAQALTRVVFETIQPTGMVGH